MIKHQLQAYLAGPEVFLENAIEIGNRKKSICKEYGIKGLFPFDNEIVVSTAEERVDQIIYRANVDMMRHADFIIVNLTPFRGPSADVGSVFELGLMIGLGKPVFGYTNVKDKFVDRVRKWGLLGSSSTDGRPRDIVGMYVENFGNIDNLMIDACFSDQGRSIISCEASEGNIFSDLTGFSACVELAAKEMKSRTYVRRAV